MNRILAIDPGVSGALAIIEFAPQPCFVACIDMPVIQPGKRRRVNAAAVADWIRKQAPDFAVVELVSSMPGDGGAGAFSFGHSAGVLDGVLAALGLPTWHVTPSAWKRTHGLIGTDKEAARALAQRLFPVAPLSRKKDSGRADALLLALHFAGSPMAQGVAAERAA